MIENILKNNQLKITPARILILKKTIDLDKPITAEELYSLIKNESKINLSTIYRNLNILVDKNIIIKVTEIDGQFLYQFNNLKHSHHLICIICKDTITLGNCPITDLEDNLAKTSGYKILSHSLEFRGICPQCLKKEAIYK